MRWAAAGGLGLVGLAVLGAAVALTRPAGAPEHRTEPLPPEECERLASRSRESWSLANRCGRDEDCVADARGGFSTGLDEACARFGPREARALADELAATWFAGACPERYEVCAPPPRAVCRAGRCSEHPPPSVPAAWRRVEFTDGVHLFVPPGLVEVDVPNEEGLARLWRSER